MSKRLQVLLDESEHRDLHAAASRDGIAVSEWVRRALRDARRQQPQGDVNRKREALRAALRHQGPTADIEQMLAEIEQGYTAPLPE